MKAIGLCSNYGGKSLENSDLRFLLGISFEAEAHC